MVSPEEARTDRRPWMVAAAVGFVAVLVVGAFLLGRSDDDDGSAAGTTTTLATTTTTAATSTTTTTTPTTTSTSSTTTSTPALDTSTAVWPFAGSGVRYTDPVEAALGFAGFLGFDEPVAGPYQGGDSRSGEVEIRPTADGPITTVLVRQLSGSDDWYVLGSATANIAVDQPAAGTAVTSPLRLQGTSTAFEANVAVRLYEDGSTTPFATGFVMGGSMGELGPFDGELTFTEPGPGFGVLVLATTSMEDGATWEASVLRVRFP